MEPISSRGFSLTGNQLKIIAMITMTCDHVGLQIFPQLQWLRILGRLAMPIYAYMIAENDETGNVQIIRHLADGQIPV